MRILLFLLVLSLTGIHLEVNAAGASRSDTIDIRKTIIEIDMTDFVTHIIYGHSTLDVKAKVNNVSQLIFDLEGLTVDSVKWNGQLTTYNMSSPNLSINLLTTMQMNDTALVDVYYHGVPVADATWGGFSFVGNYGFQMGVGFNAQPHSFGRTWHPCFDNFVERCPYEFYVTTTNDKMAVCNGMLLDSVTNANTTKTWHWKLNEEIPSYLSCVAVCNYVFVTKTLNGNNGNVEALIACEAVDSNKVNGSFSHLQESFTMLEENFGTYLWPRVGYSLVPFNAGAMEHATNIHIGKPFVDGTLTYETLIAHELSHHWWGDLVTCSTAGDMWLNEGFASYCELLHQEYTYGYDDYLTDYKANHFNVLNKAHINDQGYRAVANMDSLHTYGATVYNKGSDMIHTLRTYLGDSLFFNGLTAFLDSFKFKSVSSIDLRDFLTAYSGKDMSFYFNNWILAPGFTHFSIDSNIVTPNGNDFETQIFIRQRKHKSIDYYTHVPLEIGVYDENMNEIIFQVDFSGRCMELDVTLPFNPVMILVDPHHKLSDAITEEQKVIKSTGSTTFNQAKCKIYTKSVVNPNDSSFIRIEHSWIAPDRFKNVSNSNGYILSDSRYWKVDGIHLNNITGLIQFDYNAGANNAYLDSTWIQNTEDSIRLFYRKDATQEWTFALDSIKTGSLVDKIGSLYSKEIKAGEFCMGIKRSNYTDPMVSDAPAGGCGVVTHVSNPVHPTMKNMTLYPNPAHEQLQILFPEGMDPIIAIKIMDLNGRSVYDGWMMNTMNTGQIKLPYLSPGLYTLQAKDQHRTFNQKLVVE
ncbi:MAG: T9SS type A sorting domain-containing protein [Chitinophagaceae bacterium]|nr:T9SS type A sorting domain-containing protein [Chitinophagaceae bacterium]